MLTVVVLTVGTLLVEGAGALKRVVRKRRLTLTEKLIAIGVFRRWK